MFLPGTTVLLYLAILAFSGLAYGLYRGIQENYLADIVGINEFERGIVEFFRELPGLLLILFLAWMYKFSETRVFKIGLAIIFAATLGLLIPVNGKFIIVAFMVIYSLGEHLIMPVRTTITLSYAKPEKSGGALGIVSSIVQVGHIAGFLVVPLLFLIIGRMGFSKADAGSYRIIFAVSAALMAGVILVAAALPETRVKSVRKRFYFAKKYAKYYMLEIFYGARKQVFITFAPYVLILHYGADPSVMSLLFAVSAGAGIVFSPLIGRLIDRLGFKFIMVADTLVLVVVCLLYGFAHRLFPVHTAFIVVCVNYVLDSIISIASMASNVYVRSIASGPDEMTATISTGISVNHAISIIIALAGGWIWKVTGIEVLFSLSAVLGVINSIYAATIKVKKEDG
jgi:MFS family permease